MRCELLLYFEVPRWGTVEGETNIIHICTLGPATYDLRCRVGVQAIRNSRSPGCLARKVENAR
jgi:hypothetical protein